MERSPANSAAKEEGSHRQRKRPATLSCENCRDRKIKCDRLDPCTCCVKSGVVCIPVHRLRLPRGRHVHSSRRATPTQVTSAETEGLTNRIHKLETLVTNMRSTAIRKETHEFSQEPTVKYVSDSPNHIQDNRSTRATSATGYLAVRSDDFWADLVAEVQELREVVDSTLTLEEAVEDSAQSPAPTSTTFGSSDGGMKILGFHGPDTRASSRLDFSKTNFNPDEAASPQICQIYLQHVDPIIKILHRPSLEKWLLLGENYPGYPNGHLSTEALKSAVHYAAVSSLTESQCIDRCGFSKVTIVAEYQRVCEAALNRSGLLATRDITVLQAFVLYLFARRTEDRSRAVWTLAAVAVRVARSLGLDREDGLTNESFFIQQIRKRLWLTICLIDIQSFFVQASEPLIGHEEVAGALSGLCHINDADFGPSAIHPIPNGEGLTDMTFALVTYHLQLVGRLLNFSTRNDVGHDDPRAEWEIRQQHARQFEQSALGLLHFCDPESSPFAWFTWHGTQALVAGVKLSVLRPLYRTAKPSPRVVGDTQLLRQALQLLEKAQLMHTDPRGEGFRWYIIIPWHPIALALAECYVCNDAELVRRAWPIVEASYQMHEATIARYSGGKLRGPLGKLMRRTKEKLALHLGESCSPCVSSARPNSTLEAQQSLLGPFSPPPLLDFGSLLLETDTNLATGGPESSLLDESWQAWDEFVSAMSFDELPGSDSSSNDI